MAAPSGPTRGSSHPLLSRCVQAVAVPVAAAPKAGQARRTADPPAAPC